MPPDDIEALVRKRPFVPFRILLSTGETYDVHHPELVMVGKRSALIGITSDPTPRYDRFATISLLHVVRLEPLDGETAAT